jgi:hypothetical protein
MTAAEISWRKALLLNRSALLSAWPRHFPQHDFLTLRRIRPWPEEWRESARQYHKDRKRNGAQEPTSWTYSPQTTLCSTPR